MLELFKDKQTNLEFKLDISGNSFTPESKLCIVLYDGLSLSIKADVSDGIARICVPPLKDFLVKTHFDQLSMYLEVIADQNYFVPWSGQAVVSNSLSVGVTDVQYEKIEPKKEIKVESSMIAKNASKISFK